ncbi:hypothetical protein FB561_3047 [Kribbella amoyensis]|uniref:Uncharacterized protein n=1 Tax=Kribbella amoyensis TaxID=996641 RepID=A0A561BT22_9ACTN|nr:hypothetical protein FB561_3047 [Kribbella amoyensis]
MGFRNENPKYHTNLDIDWAVATYGHRVIDGHAVESDAFWQWLRNVEFRA